MPPHLKLFAGNICTDEAIKSKETSPAESTMGEEDDEEDYGALIYRESQLRKAEAAAAALAAAKGGER